MPRPYPRLPVLVFQEEIFCSLDWGLDIELSFMEYLVYLTASKDIQDSQWIQIHVANIHLGKKIKQKK